jgi:membrane protein insertase Oxa1/YidC/SpoIIIJ
MVPMVASFPQGVFVYWITNSLYAVTQLRIMRLPVQRRLFGIVDPKEKDALHKLELSLRPPKKAFSTMK